MSSQVSDIATERAMLLIGGAWTAGTATFQVYDTFTGALIGDADRASKEGGVSAPCCIRPSSRTSSRCCGWLGAPTT